MTRRKQWPHSAATLATTLIVCLLLAAAPGEVLAQGESSAPADPKVLLKQGNKLFQEGDYPAAYKQFKAGFDLKPDPVFMRSMAYSLLKMLQHEKAKNLLLQYLKKHPRARDRRKIKEIISGLDTVIQTRVEITSAPAGADIYIDTEAGGKVGRTPYKGTIEPGAHLVILRTKGYRTTTKDFNIKPRQELKVKVALEVTLKLSSDPAGAVVRVGKADGPVLGKTPMEIGVAPGKRSVYLSLPGYKTYKRNISATPGKATTLAAKMLLGFKVSSAPAGATVLLDGKAIKGKTPMEVGAQAGAHQVTVKLGSFKPVTRKVSLSPGSSADMHVAFEGGLLSMRTIVPGAEVKVGELKVGTTPFKQAVVPRGDHEVKVTHPDRRDFAGSLKFQDGHVVDADLEMGRPLWPVWTAGGFTLAGVVAGTVTGLLARQKVTEANEAAPNRCMSTGDPYPGIDASECGNGLHHASTASLITAGVAAGVGLVYYLVWGRPDLKVKKSKLTASR